MISKTADILFIRKPLLSKLRSVKLNSGMTLIELMLTVSIIGVMLTILFLKVDTFLPRSRMESACRQLVGKIDKLRLASIVTYKVPIYFEYDLKNHGYSAYVPFEYTEDGELKGPGETELISFTQLPENIILDDVRLGMTADYVDYEDLITVLVNPDGSITGHIVHLKDVQYGKEFSISIASLTGFAEIHDSRVEYEEFDGSY